MRRGLIAVGALVVAASCADEADRAGLGQDVQIDTRSSGGASVSAAGGSQAGRGGGAGTAGAQASAGAQAGGAAQGGQGGESGQGEGGQGGGKGGAGQGGSGEGGKGDAGAAGAPFAPATFAEVRAIFAGCGSATTCHGRTPPTGGLDLFADGLYTRLVDAPSTGAPGVLRVVPGDLKASLLYRKLTGDLAEGEGGRMLADDPELAERVVRGWVLSGAPPD